MKTDEKHVLKWSHRFCEVFGKTPQRHIAVRRDKEGTVDDDREIIKIWACSRYDFHTASQVSSSSYSSEKTNLGNSVIVLGCDS